MNTASKVSIASAMVACTGFGFALGVVVSMGDRPQETASFVAVPDEARGTPLPEATSSTEQSKALADNGGSVDVVQKSSTSRMPITEADTAVGEATEPTGAPVMASVVTSIREASGGPSPLPEAPSVDQEAPPTVPSAPSTAPPDETTVPPTSSTPPPTSSGPPVGSGSGGAF